MKIIHKKSIIKSSKIQDKNLWKLTADAIYDLSRSVIPWWSDPSLLSNIKLHMCHMKVSLPQAWHDNASIAHSLRQWRQSQNNTMVSGGNLSLQTFLCLKDTQRFHDKKLDFLCTFRFYESNTPQVFTLYSLLTDRSERRLVSCWLLHDFL